MSKLKQLTADDFRRWENANGAAIDAERERNHRVVLDEVIRSVLCARKHGKTLSDAGDSILKWFHYGNRDGTDRTYAGVERALREIGWKPRRERRHGIDR